MVGLKVPQYLIKQRRGWYATLEVPKALRAKLGKVRFKETLHTDSLKVAEVRKHTLIAQWKAEIEAARGNLDVLDKLYLAQQQREAAIKKKEPVKLTTAMVDYVMAVAGPASPLSENEKTELSEISSGKKFPLNRFLPDYETFLVHLEEKSKNLRISYIKRFVKKFKYAEDATNREVRDWIEQNLIAEEGLTPITCKKIISNIRQYWKYLVDRKDLTVPEPFKDVVPARAITIKKAVAQRRKHFEAEDYQNLLKAAQENKDSQLSNLIQLGAYTGCRIEELCSLKVDNVKNDRIEIEDAKTATGWRTIPIHESIIDLVATMKKESRDGYLISGLSYNKYKDRSNAIGKRFSKLKTKLGYNNQYVFHSFRKGVATQLEYLGISENVSANLLGHNIPTMTYGIYSGNRLAFTLLQETINKLKWD